MPNSIVGNSEAHIAFLKIYNAAPADIVEIPFNEEWCNSTGYFDHLVHADLGLKSGDRFKSVTPDANNRKIVGIVTPVGNVVFFERYTDGAAGVITNNTPHELSQIIKSGSTSADTINQYAMFKTMNIGHLILSIVHRAKELSVAVAAE